MSSLRASYFSRFDLVPECVLVTGGTGFIAQHCIVQLLDAGYHVRTSVRSVSREAELVEILSPHVSSGVLEGRFSVVGADLIDDAGWDEAVADCAYVLHVASPIFLKVPKDENEMIIPARDGTLRVLRAASNAGVKRVVMTSSVAAVAYGVPRDHAFTEKDWSNPNRRDVDPYAKSKTVAERAAWDFMSSLPHSTSMDLTTILPGLVLGPLLSGRFSSSGEAIKRMLEHDIPGMPAISFPPIDVRDVAWAHVAAMTSPVAGGERFLCGNESVPLVEIAKILAEKYNPLGYKVPTRTLPKIGVRIAALFDRDLRFVIPEIGHPTVVDASKVRDVLGLRPRGLQEMSYAMADSMIKYGVVKAPK
jgi:nucleoside-diphosphate-sugar epimerase